MREFDYTSGEAAAASLSPSTTRFGGCWNSSCTALTSQWPTSSVCISGIDCIDNRYVAHAMLSKSHNP